MRNLTSYYNIHRLEPAILDLITSKAISILSPDGMYAQGMVFYSNPHESVLFDFDSQYTWPVDGRACVETEKYGRRE